jgi:hypothetical protein
MMNIACYPRIDEGRRIVDRENEDREYDLIYKKEVMERRKTGGP